MSDHKLRSIPRVVQLPGGVKLYPVPFKIVERNADGSPKTFELLPAGTGIYGEDKCALFADEAWIRAANPSKAP